MITSVGYAGTVTDDDWRDLATKAISHLYGVESYASWRVTAAPGDRMVQIAPGGAFGLGVFDTNDAVVQRQLGTVASGSRWDLIAAHRDWAAETTTLISIPGSAAKAIPARDTGFGGENDQPLALVRIDAGKTTPQEIVDLRCFAGDGGLLAMDDLARQYLDRIGTSVRIGDIVWNRVVDAVGTPVWISSDMSDTGWVAATPGPGWENASGYPFELRAVGPSVHMRGALLAKTPVATIFNLGTIPELFRPNRNVFLGAYHGGYSTSGTHVGELLLTPAGLLMSPQYYYDGSLGVGGVVPVHGNWFRG